VYQITGSGLNCSLYRLFSRNLIFTITSPVLNSYKASFSVLAVIVVVNHSMEGNNILPKGHHFLPKADRGEESSLKN
jgi:hypothetical protein